MPGQNIQDQNVSAVILAVVGEHIDKNCLKSYHFTVVLRSYTKSFVEHPEDMSFRVTKLCGKF